MIEIIAVLMTVLSTVLGALPLALATGAGAESRIAIGVVVIGGLLLSTLLTLFLVPTMYMIFEEWNPRKFEKEEQQPSTALGQTTALPAPE